MVKTLNVEIKLMGVFPVQKVVTELAELFQQEFGHTVTAAFATSGVIRQKLISGEPADIIILNDNEIIELADHGVVNANTRANIARFGLGVVVSQGAPLPDISTPEKLKKALLTAKSIAYADPLHARGGAHVATIVQKFGIADAVRNKTIFSGGGSSTSEAVAKGKAEIGIQGMGKTILAEGTVVAGPLPDELQKFMSLSACVTNASAVPEAARAFVAFLARLSFRPRFAEEGLA